MVGAFVLPHPIKMTAIEWASNSSPGGGKSIWPIIKFVAIIISNAQLFISLQAATHLIPSPSGEGGKRLAIRKLLDG